MISNKAKYALQALSYLSRNYSKKENPILIQSIAKEQNIPLKFLESILLELKNKGILLSKRGKFGGYYLKNPPQNTSLADILRIIDGPIALVSCVSLNFYKPCENCNEQTCTIKPILAKARDAVLKVLTKYNLKDLGNKKLKNRIGL